MAIRQPPSSINDPNLRGFLQELRNAIGKTGDQVAKVAMRVQQITNTPVTPEPPVTPQPPQPPVILGDGFPPPAPTSLTTTPDAWAIRLTWEQPAAMPDDYDVTEIWCRNATSGDKVLAGSLRGNQYVFTGLDSQLLSNADTWYFWVRNKDVENLTSAFYPNDDAGVSGQALPSPENYIGDLIGDITSGTLYQYLGAKIGLLQGPSGIPGSVQARLSLQYDDLVRRISEVTVSGNGTIDTTKIWYFDTALEGWTATGSGSVSVASGAIRFQSGAANDTLRSPALNPALAMTTYPVIRARIKSSGSWDGTIKLTNSASPNVTFTFTPTTAPPNGGSAYADYDWDLAAAFGTFDPAAIIRIEFVANNNSVDLYADWIAVGRLAPGASYSQVEAIQVLSDKKNRSFFVPNSGAPNYAGPSNPYSDGYVLKEYDLWVDTGPEVYGNGLVGQLGALLHGGNKPHRWNSNTSTWDPTTDTRLADSWAEIYDIGYLTANPAGAAAKRINGIGANAAAANEAVQTKAWRTDTETYYAGGYNSLSLRLSGMESSVSGKNAVFIQSTAPSSTGRSLGDLWYDTTDPTRVVLKRWKVSPSPAEWIVQRTDTKVYYTSSAGLPATANLLAGDLWYDTANNNKPYVWNATLSRWDPVLDNYISTNISASINDMQKARIGYATVAIAHTYLGVAYAVGEIFEGNGTTVIYPVSTYSAAAYPQYAATDRKTIIDEQGVLNWNTIVGVTGAVKWNTGLPLATAIKQVRVSDGTDSLTIEQQFTAKKNTDNQLLGQYTVKIDTNGWVSGFGLASQSFPDGSVVSDFGVRADRFWIGSPENPVTSVVRDLLNLGGSAVIKTVQGRLTPTGPNEWFAVLQTTTAHGLATNEWFTLKDIRQTANTTNSDNFKKIYNGSWIAAAVGIGSIYDTFGATYQLSLLGVTNSSYVVIFRTTTNLGYGYTSTQTVPPYDNKAQLVPNKNVPFIVTNQEQRYNGVLVPAGVFMNAAYISDATITSAKIADAVVTNQKMSGPIYSDDFVSSGGDPTKPVAVPGTLGWCITRTGDAVFNTVIARTKNIESNGVTASGGYSNTSSPPLRRTVSQGELLFWSPSQSAVTYGRGNIAFTATISSYVFAGTNATQPMTPAIHVYRNNTLVRQIPFTSKTLSGPLTMTVAYLDTLKSDAATIYEFRLIASITTVAADAYIDLNSIDEYWVEYKR